MQKESASQKNIANCFAGFFSGVRSRNSYKSIAEKSMPVVCKGVGGFLAADILFNFLSDVENMYGIGEMVPWVVPAIVSATVSRQSKGVCNFIAHTVIRGIIGASVIPICFIAGLAITASLGFLMNLSDEGFESSSSGLLFLASWMFKIWVGLTLKLFPYGAVGAGVGTMIANLIDSNDGVDSQLKLDDNDEIALLDSDVDFNAADSVTDSKVAERFVHAGLRMFSALICTAFAKYFVGRKDEAFGAYSDLAFVAVASAASALLSGNARKPVRGMLNFIVGTVVGTVLLPLCIAALTLSSPTDEVGYFSSKKDFPPLIYFAISLFRSTAKMNIPYAILGAVVGSFLDYFIRDDKDEAKNLEQGSDIIAEFRS